MKRTATFLVGIFLLATVMLAGHAAAQDCVEPPAGLISWWPGDGNADDIIGGHDGTPVNGAGFAPGFVAEAFSFDGVGGGRNDRVDLPSEALNGLSDFTVDLWINTTDSNGGIFLGANFSEDNEFLLHEFASPTFVPPISFRVILKGNVEDHPILVNDGTWRHVAFTREGSTGRLYIDGVLADPRTFPVGPLDIRPRGLMLGQEQDCLAGCFQPDQAFDGLIDEVEVFERALEASEIPAIFDAGSAGKCKPPPPPTLEELLERIEDLEDHTHTYRTGRGVGHNNTEAETGPALPPLE